MKKLVKAILWFSVAQFLVLLITGLFGITPIEETFFPTLGMVAFFGGWHAINRERQKKADWVEANRLHREALLAGGKRATWPPQRPADAGAEFHVDVELERLRAALHQHNGYVDPSKGVNPTKPWPRAEQPFTDHSRKPSSRTPDQYSRRTDKPADSVTVIPDPMPAQVIQFPTQEAPTHRAECTPVFQDTGSYSPPDCSVSDTSAACTVSCE